MQFNISTLVPAIVGIVLLLLSMRFLLRRTMVGAVIRALVGLVLLSGSVLAFLAAMDLLSYRQLLKEESVVTLQFEKLKTQTYRVILVDSRGHQYRYHLKGDQWQLDARLIRWHPSLANVGFGSLYRLERISGRYSDFRQEMSAERTIHQLESSPYVVDTWVWLKQLPWLREWVDAQYGSATFMPMAHGAIFEVKLGFAGLVARPVNSAGKQAVSGWQ
ncbi:MAG: cation/multidrug efflux pump [Porticoccus sp.]